MYFDKTCNITTTTYTKVGGSSKRVDTTLYSGIECNFEVAKKGIEETETSKNKNALKYQVIVPIQYDLIRNNYNIELIDDTLGSVGMFVISDIQSFKSYTGIDCIMFIATEIQGQL